MGLSKYIIITKATGTSIKNFTTILEACVEFFKSSSNFFLSNKVLSMEEKTATIFPPVLFKIVKEEEI